MKTLASGAFCFYRRVWQADRRLVQGFIVDADTMLSALVTSALATSPLREQVSVTIVSNGEVLKSFGEQSPSPYLEVESSLSPPLRC